MVTVLRSLLLMCLVAFAGFAHALVPVANKAEYRASSSAAWVSSAETACRTEVDVQNAKTYPNHFLYLRFTDTSSPYELNCVAKVFNSNGSTQFAEQVFGSLEKRIVQACPANSSPVTGGCQCSANYDEVGGQCKPHVDQCAGQTGKTGVLNWTEGYTRTPDEGDRKAVGTVYSPPSSGNVCLGSCSVSLQTSGPGVQPLVSQAPTSQGLYRRSVDYPYVALGTSCNPGVADVGADKNATPPDCPGTVGEYSGHPVCVGTAAKPVIASGMPQAPGSTPIAGNPTAGDKPATGEGSGSGSAGRTPSGGDGTAKGGPADAGKGGKGGEAGGTADGTGVSPKRTDDKEPDACGAPGQPECSVRVNEKGTPEGAGTTFDSAKAKLDETKGKNDENLAKVSGSGDKGFLEPIRSLFWAPPVAACETFDLPQQVGGLKLDPCGVVDGVRNVMAFLWAATGLFLCFRMIKGSF